MACLAASAACPALAQDIPDGEMTDLGTPGEGEFGAGTGVAVQVSDDGSTVMGFIRQPGGSVRLVIWRNGVLTDITPADGFLKDFLVTSPSVQGLPIFLSGDGSTVLGAMDRTDGNLGVPFRFRDGTTINIDQAIIPRGLSADGNVVVGSTSLDIPDMQARFLARAFRLDANGLQILDPLSGDTSSGGSAISADGRVTVGFSATDSSVSAVRWVGTSVEDLGSVGNHDLSEAFLVSADGSVIAGRLYSFNLPLPNRGFVWRDGIMTDLGTLGGAQTFVEAISADGSTIIGRSEHTNPAVDTPAQGFVWRDGVMQEIGYLPTDNARGAYTIPRAVSGDGRVIVGVARAPVTLEGNFNGVAFRWEDGVIENLGTLGGHSSYATDVSTDGTTIVGWAENAVFERRPFIYRTQMQDFSNLIASFARQADEAEIVAEQQQLLTRQIGARTCTPGEAGFCLTARGFGLRTAADQGTGIGRRSAGAISLHGAVRLFEGLALGAAWGEADSGVRGDRQSERTQRAWSVSADLGAASRWESGIGGRLWFARSTNRLELTRGAGFENVQPLTGTARQTGKAYGAEARLGFEAFGETPLTARIAVARATTKRRAYAETGGDYPASYDALSIDRTIAQATFGAAQPLGQGTLWFELGGETDLESDPVVVSGASEIPGMERFAMPSGLERHKLRGTMIAGYALPLGALDLGLEVSAVTPAYGGRWQTGVSITVGAAL
ncbi:hypothetical protein [Erythrobacter donghaensis]|uniref:hypothetical protein n=1 Tax=Erythrobacter donghaensis TaxID=267135 RepID=UPI001302C723|nr:hypothetical protein [Erythrobacter donghaensis]